MISDPLALDQRVRALERRLLRTRIIALAGFFALVGMSAARTGDSQVADSIRARRIALVDDKGVERVVLAQDPVDTPRRERACGLTVHDATGAERGGFSTFDDKSVVLAMDAPQGVGDPMPDRLGLGVDADGSAHVALIDNTTRMPVRLVSDAAGGGGLEFIGYDLDKGVATIKRTSFTGATKQEIQLGDGK